MSLPAKARGKLAAWMAVIAVYPSWVRLSTVSGVRGSWSKRASLAAEGEGDLGVGVMCTLSVARHCARADVQGKRIEATMCSQLKKAPMLHNFETLEANEPALIAEMTDILRRKMERDYAKGATHRDAHPKSLGVLRGTFTIEPDLPLGLQVGIFKKAMQHACWVRVSNASGKPQSDAVPDFRGFAIKLMALDADNSGAEEPMGQDFVLMSLATMPLGTIRMFKDAVYFSIERSPLLLLLKLVLTGKSSVLKALKSGRTNPTSPLDLRYWSTTPYLWGKTEAVKYSILPTSSQRSVLPAKLTDNYLSLAMQAHLEASEASFDFCVQLRRADMPIENAGQAWDETDSPFVKVATLRLAKQHFLGNTEREAMSEILSFSPGHAWPDHAPLGGINRARVAIYTALSKFRHERDGRHNIA